MMISAGVVITVPRREFYELWRSADNGKCVQTILGSLLVKEGLEERDVIRVQDFKRNLSKYGADMYKYFRQQGGISERFLEKCAWLDREPFQFTVDVVVTAAPPRREDDRPRASQTLDRHLRE